MEKCMLCWGTGILRDGVNNDDRGRYLDWACDIRVAPCWCATLTDGVRARILGKEYLRFARRKNGVVYALRG